MPSTLRDPLADCFEKNRPHEFWIFPVSAGDIVISIADKNVNHTFQGGYSHT